MIKTRKAIWQWVWAAKIAKYGFTHEELASIYSRVRRQLPIEVDLSDLISWIGKIQDEAEREKTKRDKSSRSK